MSPLTRNTTFRSLDDALELWDRRKRRELMTRRPGVEAPGASSASSVGSFSEAIAFDKCSRYNIERPMCSCRYQR